MLWSAFDISTEISNITINYSYSVKKRSPPLEDYMIKIMLQDIKRDTDTVVEYNSDFGLP